MTVTLYGPNKTHILGKIHTGSEEYVANARLIAAAPEMLEALERVLPLIPGHTKLGCQGDCSACVAQQEARAAIAKATGEQQ